MSAAAGPRAGGGGRWVGVKYDLPEGWHIYWSNPGQSGMETWAEIALPEGWSAGPAEYPGPDRFESPGGLTTYGYHGEAALLFRLAIPEGAEGELRFQTGWLLCKEICVPGSTEVALTWPAVEDPSLATLVEALPAPLPSGVEVGAACGERGPRFTAPGADRLSFFPSVDAELDAPGAAAEGDRLELDWPNGPADIDGVLRVERPGGVDFYRTPLPCKSRETP